MQKTKEKVNKGITLISLVITITILLILAGVSINILVGENGILNKAQDAKEKIEKAKDDELRQIAIAEATMNFENTEYTDRNGEKVTIPAGFAVSQIEGENTVDDGLVIIDSEGNEFVWVPAYKEGEKKKFKNAVEYKKWEGTKDYTFPNFDGIDETPTGIDEMSQISKYGGFFVGRYEAGRNDIDEASVATNNVSNGVTLLIKKGAQPWNYINYYNAKTVSEKYLNNEYVQSGLITGTQWDTIMKWAQDGEKKNVTTGNIDWGTYRDTLGIAIKNGRYGFIVDDKTKWNTGDYTKQNEEVVFIGTGLNEKSVTHNIYDMAGNLWEITTEWSIQDNKRILARGGSGNNYNTLSPMARSQNMPDIHMFNDAGFRVVLYLK